MLSTLATIENLAVVLGVLCVWLTTRQNIICWPVGLAMVSLYIVIFYDAKLYSDMLLQVVYVFLQLYGWYAWLYGGRDQSPLQVARVSHRGIVMWTIVCLLGTITLGATMSQYTDASFPFVDAFTTVASLIAQWLMGRKVLESWLVWIVVDLVSIPLYVAKELYATSILYGVFLFLATMGYFQWRRSMHVPVTA